MKKFEPSNSHQNIDLPEKSTVLISQSELDNPAKPANKSDTRKMRAAAGSSTLSGPAAKTLKDILAK